MQRERTPKKQGKVVVQFTFKNLKEYERQSRKLHDAAADVKAHISVREV